MSKVTVDDALWNDSRFALLEQLIRRRRTETIGLLVLFWNLSRRLKKEQLSSLEVQSCIVDLEKEELFKALMQTGYLQAETQMDSDGAALYRVPDNEDWHRRAGRLRQVGSKGGNARAQARKTTRKTKASPAQAIAKPDTAAVWEQFGQAYVGRYGFAPVRNAKTNSCMTQLIQRLGIENVTEVLKFYVAHEDPFYRAKMHDISFATRDAESLFTQYKRGETVTREGQNHDRLTEQLNRLSRVPEGRSAQA